MKGDRSLVISALTDNRRLISSNNTFTCSTGIKNILALVNKHDIWDKPNIIKCSNFNDTIVSSLQNVYSSLWSHQINTFQSKLRTYCVFKQSFQMENYVMLLSRSSRIPFCKLRISAHMLMIEKGRYLSPKVNSEDRLCKLCDRNEVEDEFHFIMKCTLYDKKITSH